MPMIMREASSEDEARKVADIMEDMAGVKFESMLRKSINVWYVFGEFDSDQITRLAIHQALDQLLGSGQQ